MIHNSMGDKTHKVPHCLFYLNKRRGFIIQMSRFRKKYHAFIVLENVFCVLILGNFIPIMSMWMSFQIAEFVLLETVPENNVSFVKA